MHPCPYSTYMTAQHNYFRRSNLHNHSCRYTGNLLRDSCHCHIGTVNRSSCVGGSSLCCRIFFFSPTAVPEQYLPLCLGLCSTKQLKNTIEIDSINSIGHYEVIKLCSDSSINLKKNGLVKRVLEWFIIIKTNTFLWQQFFRVGKIGTTSYITMIFFILELLLNLRVIFLRQSPQKTTTAHKKRM